MAQKMCLRHPDKPATALCFQCHKPVCGECVVTTDKGNFCGSECIFKYDTFKEKYKVPKRKKPSMPATIAKLIILVVLILIAIHAGNRYAKLEFLKDFDVIGAWILKETPK